MITLGLYLLKVSVCLGLFYALYLVLFRNHTFFAVNRYYLVIGLILSFVVPFVEIPLSESNRDGVLLRSLESSFYEPVYESIPFRHSVSESGSVGAVLLSVYVAGMMVALFRLGLSVRKITKIKNRSETERIDNMRIVRTEFTQPFSFFNLIFLPRHEASPLILAHEKVHVTQFHWVDLMLVEIASAVLWFNPMLRFYKRSIKIQHEYLADAETVQNDGRLEYYLNCLLRQVTVENTVTPVSQFYSQSIKQRIHMMTRKKTPIPFSLTYLILIPVVCLMLLAFSDKPVTSPLSSNLVSMPAMGKLVIGSPEEHKPSIAPVNMENVKSVYGYGERINPFTNQKQLHSGIDFAMAAGEPVMSTADGVVFAVITDDQRGIFVIIKHGSVYTTQYSHLSQALIKEGDIVKQKQIIGYVGSTGLTTGPHLHYEIFKNGEIVNPKDYIPNLDDC
jgi:beta-lactamase regulating signal transducer with metallopeptidase domain